MPTNESGTPQNRIVSIPKPIDGELLTAASVNPALEGLMSLAERSRMLAARHDMARNTLSTSMPAASTTYDVFSTWPTFTHIATWATSVRSSYLLTLVLRLRAITNPKVYTARIAMIRENAGPLELLKFGNNETLDCAVAGVSYEFTRQAILTFLPTDVGAQSYRNGRFGAQIDTPAGVSGGGNIEFCSLSLVSVFGDQLT
jgi:hypothetical protein